MKGVGAVEAGAGMLSGAIEYTMIRDNDADTNLFSTVEFREINAPTYPPCRLWQSIQLEAGLGIRTRSSGQRTRVGQGDR